VKKLLWKNSAAGEGKPLLLLLTAASSSVSSSSGSAWLNNNRGCVLDTETTGMDFSAADAAESEYGERGVISVATAHDGLLLRQFDRYGSGGEPEKGKEDGVTFFVRPLNELDSTSSLPPKTGTNESIDAVEPADRDVLRSSSFEVVSNEVFIKL
jgi:hypothetical protein